MLAEAEDCSQIKRERESSKQDEAKDVEWKPGWKGKKGCPFLPPVEETLDLAPKSAVVSLLGLVVGKDATCDHWVPPQPSMSLTSPSIMEQHPCLRSPSTNQWVGCECDHVSWLQCHLPTTKTLVTTVQACARATP